MDEGATGALGSTGAQAAARNKSVSLTDFTAPSALLTEAVPDAVSIEMTVTSSTTPVSVMILAADDRDGTLHEKKNTHSASGHLRTQKNHNGRRTG